MCAGPKQVDSVDGEAEESGAGLWRLQNPPGVERRETAALGVFGPWGTPDGLHERPR